MAIGLTQDEIYSDRDAWELRARSVGIFVAGFGFGMLVLESAIF